MKTKRFLSLFILTIISITSYSQTYCMKNESTCANWQFRVNYNIGVTNYVTTWTAIPAGPNQGGCVTLSGTPTVINSVQVRIGTGAAVSVTPASPTNTITCVPFGTTNYNIEYVDMTYGRIYP